MKEWTDSWTMETAGGPVGKDGFFLNPMQDLNLHEAATLQLRCGTVKTFAGKKHL